MSRTTGERKEVGFSIKMSTEEMAFLEARKEQMNYTSVAEALREFVTAARTWYGLPLFMAERLQAEMESRNLDFLSYVRELLAKHSEELGRTPPAAAPVKSPRR
jgi:hypothetical protein